RRPTAGWPKWRRSAIFSMLIPQPRICSRAPHVSMNVWRGVVQARRKRLRNSRASSANRTSERHRRDAMAQKITHGIKAMLKAAEAEIEALPAADAVALQGRDDTVLVDLRDPR